jgi:hypothetical protein
MELVMKVLQLILTLLIMTYAQVVTGFTQTSSGGSQDLLSMPIDNLELEAANIGLLLSEFASKKKVPIGFEVSPEDDLLQTKPMRLQIKNATLADVLNSIVKQNPLYTWKIQDEVVNVFPVEAKRDPLLRDVLEMKLGKFSIPRGMTRFDLRQSLGKVPAIKTLLTEHKVVPENQSFMSRDFVPLGQGYGLEVSNVSVSALLNQVVRDSQTKYWIVLRYGDSKQYFVLNL